jgi:hypothetical protein
MCCVGATHGTGSWPSLRRKGNCGLRMGQARPPPRRGQRAGVKRKALASEGKEPDIVSGSSTRVLWQRASATFW